MTTAASDTGNRKKPSLAWIFLAAGCMAAGVAYWQSRNMVARELASQIELRATEAKYVFEGEMGSYVALLRGLQAQVALQPNLSAADFRRLSRVLGLDRHLPGAQAVAFVRRLAPNELAGFEAGMQRQLAGSSLGYPAPRIHPPPPPGNAYVLQYVEPTETNSSAAWFDLGSEPHRRAAIRRARDTGDWSSSGRIRLALAPGNVEGVIFFLPVYRDGTVPATLEARRAQFVGAVEVVVRIDEMLRHMFGSRLLRDLDIELYDMQEQREEAPKHDAHNLVFDSGALNGEQRLHAGNPDFPISHRFELNMGGDLWHMEVTALPAFVHHSQMWLPPFAALSVLLLSLLAWHFTRTLERSRRSLHAQAQQIVEALHSKELQLARIAESIDSVLWRIEPASGHLHFVSPAVERVTGRKLDEYYRDPLLWRKSIHPDDWDKIAEMVKRIVRSGRETLEYRILRPDGSLRWIRCEAHYNRGTEPGAGFIDGVDNDITEQRELEESLRRSNRALLAIHECEEAIATIDDETLLLQRICDVAVKVGYRMAWAGVLREGEGSLLFPVALAGDHRGYLSGLAPLLEAGRMENFPTIGSALTTRRPAVLADFDNDAVPAVVRGEAVPRGLRSKVALPICHEETMIGVLNVYAAEPDAFDAAGVELLCDMAQSLAVALQASRHRCGRRAAEANARLRERAIEASANAIIITGAQAPGYPIEYVNPAFEQITGYTAAEVIGKNPGFMHGQDRDQPGLAVLRALLQQQAEGHAVVRNYRKDGTPYWSDTYVAPVKNDAGEVTHFVAAKYDITATKRYEAELEFQASYDVLTGLANRNLLRDRLQQSIAYAARHAHPVWIAFLNLDRFKMVNETLGFAAGDQLLKQVAAVMRSAVRDTDTVARLSGDEFVIIMPEPTDDMAASAAINRLLQAVAQPLAIDGQEFLPTCSVGVAAYPADGEDPDMLIKNAHIAMYRAKEAGGNALRFYMPAMNEHIVERQQIERDLRNALEREEFELFYQPQVDLRSGKVAGMEALLRWRHPKLGMVPPARFIGLAEETGLIVPIGAWVVRTACRQNRAWQQAGFGNLRVAVNVSARQFAQAELVQSIADALQETGLDPRCLDIELTESLVMADVERAVGVLRDLKALGVHLSVDDFGTGYSSLAYLKRFPIDMLKIDQSFVRDIVSDPDDAAIVRSIVSLAHSLRLHVIAEGVETEAQLAFLRHHDCDQMQGYLFGRPIPAAEFLQMLQDGKCLSAAGGEGGQVLPTEAPSPA